jgi:hypothetical protein
MYKAYGPSADLNLPQQLTAQRRAQLDASSFDQLLASYRAAVKDLTSSRFWGVSWDDAQSCWLAEIWMDGAHHPLSSHAVEAEAARAYDHAAKEYLGA